jgi:hypothetical protein
MLVAKIKIPSIEVRTVWAGIYGGHYDVIGFFSSKPVSEPEEHLSGFGFTDKCF